jgi:hypothetical protein
MTTSRLELTKIPRRRTRFGLRHRWPASAWVLLLARGQGGYQSQALGLLEWAVAAARTVGIAAASERIRTLQAAQAGGPMPAEAMTAAPDLWRNVFRQEGEYWTVVFDGAVVRLRDAKGPRYLARLLAHPGREFHTLDLEATEAQAAPTAPRGVRASGGEPELAVRRDLGDAGALLDATAKAAYQARIQELRAELEEAEGGNDPIRAAKARHELDFLVEELARAVGLGGRDRRAATHAERARLNVTRAIRAAMAHLTRANPALGRHLAATVRTGLYCAYTPDPRLPITWERWPGPSAPGLNPGAPRLNAHPADEGSARRRSRGARRGAPGKRRRADSLDRGDRGDRGKRATASTG